MNALLNAMLVIALLQAAPQTRSAEEDRRRIEEARLHNDWAFLNRYREADARLPPPARGEKRVVFMGDSITEGWARFLGSEFRAKPYVNRGIGGQTTPQMFVRFRQDVIVLRPAAVVILAGINDIAGNTVGKGRERVVAPRLRRAVIRLTPLLRFAQGRSELRSALAMPRSTSGAIRKIW